MRTWIVPSLGIVLAVFASLFAVRLASREEAPEVTRADMDRLRDEIASLRSAMVSSEDLRAAIADATRLEMRERLARASRPATEAAEEPSEMAQEAVAIAGREGVSEPAEPPMTEDERTSAQWVGLVQSSRGDWDATVDHWKKIIDSGKFDEVVAALQEMADQQPMNADVRYDLGNAFLQRVLNEEGLSRGLWAIKADAAFDDALEIQPRHWGARFTKAVSLANWPASEGKTGGAIREFETLIEQQNALSPEPHHAEPFYYLGNLYLNRGEVDRALAVWQQGLEKFPQNGRLRQQVETNR